MVGYADPCPCCGHKRRRRLSLDRWATWPLSRCSSVAVPASKLARTASSPIGSSSAVDHPPVPPPFPCASPISVCCHVRGPHESSPSPMPPSSSVVPAAAAESPTPTEAATAVAPDPPRSPAAEVTPKEYKKKKEGDEEEKEEKQEEEEEKKRVAEISVSYGTQLKVYFKCKCGSCEEVAFTLDLHH